MTEQNAENNQPIDNQEELLELTPEMQAFFTRADLLINVANEQVSQECHTGQVGGSLTYAAARFAAFASSIGFQTSDEYLAEKEQIVDYYSKQFKQMLADNIDDYGKNFDKYTEASTKE